MLTVQEAREYLKKERGITVSRQAIHGLIARSRAECERIGGSKKKAGIWLIPFALLRHYRPLAQQQEAGRVPHDRQRERARRLSSPTLARQLRNSA